MSLDELKRSLAGGERPLIVDVREPGEFDGPLGHIDGAINIPLAQLPAV
jgi:3-mercaptopyruvate sulfurtransferase SseA